MTKKLFATTFGIIIGLLALSLSIGSAPTTAKGGDNFNNVRVDPEGAAVGEEDPTMVAHPTQADTLYVAWKDEGDGNIYFSSSTDGGQTWQAARLLVDDTGSSYHPTLAIGADGTLYLAWGDYRRPSGIYFAKSTDGGMTWSARQKVNDSTDSFGWEPTLAVGSDGTLYLAWRRSGIFFTYSTDGGQNWSASQKVNDDADSDSQFGPVIAAGPAGTVYLTWQDGRNGDRDIYFARSTNNGESFHANQKINDDTGSSDQYGAYLVADENGVVYIAWTDRRNGSFDIYLARSGNAGEDWTPNQNAYSSNFAEIPSLIMGADNTVYIAWKNLGGINFASSNDDGQTWDVLEEQLEGFEVGNPRNLVLTMGADGIFYIAHDSDQDRVNNPNIYLARSTNGQSWLQYQVNDESGKGTQSDSMVALDPAGTVYVMWQDSRRTWQNNSYFARSTDNGQTWSAGTPINEGVGDVFAVDSDGTLIVAWLDYDFENRGVYVATSTDGGQSFTDGVKVNDNTGKTNLSTPILYVGTDNTLYLLWTDRRNDRPDLYFSRSTDGGQNWSANTKVNDDTGTTSPESPTLAVDESGMLYLAWVRRDKDSTRDIYFARSTDGGQTWSANVKVNDNASTLYKESPTLVVDSNGTLYLAWQDLNNSWEIYFSRSLDGGQNWQANVTLKKPIGFTQASGRPKPQLAVTPSGALYLVASALIQGQSHSLYLTHSTNGGENWQEPLGIDDDGRGLSSISMVTGSDETIYLAWSNARYGADNAFFAQGQYQGGDEPEPPTYQLYLPSVMR